MAVPKKFLNQMTKPNVPCLIQNENVFTQNENVLTQNKNDLTQIKLSVLKNKNDLTQLETPHNHKMKMTLKKMRMAQAKK